MGDSDPIAILHRGMTRQGPGTAADVHWALERLGVPGDARIMDAGCGPGADLRALGEARPEAVIEGVDAMAHLVDEARAACADLANVAVALGDMSKLQGPYDLIWCAGALYFLGVTEGLQTWRNALAPGGVVAFSEPCLAVDAPESAREFWADYPAVSDLEGIRARVNAAGYRVLDHRLVVGQAWAGYYAGLGDRVAALKPEASGELAALLAATEREIALWTAAPEHVAYALLLVRPDG